MNDKQRALQWAAECGLGKHDPLMDEFLVLFANKAFNAGMERAAAIVVLCPCPGDCADAIRKEIKL